MVSFGQPQGLSTRALVIPLAVVLATTAGSSRSEGDAGFLAGAELQKILSGHTLRGSEWAEYYEPNGMIRGKARLFGTRSYGGRWSVQSDRVCYDYEGTSYDTCSRLRIQGTKVLHFDLHGKLKTDGVATRAEGNQLAAFD